MNATDLIIGAAIGMAAAISVVGAAIAIAAVRPRRAPVRQARGLPQARRPGEPAPGVRSPARPGSGAFLTLREHWALLRAGAPIIIAAVAIATLVAIAISSSLPRRWTASATLYVGQSLTEPSFDYGGLLASQLLTPTYARLATAADLLEAVADELGLDEEPESLAQRIETDVPVGSTIITVRGTSDTPEDAAALANAVAEQLLLQAPAERDDQAELEGALAALDDEIESTRASLLELLGESDLTPAEQATATQLQQRLETLESTRRSLAAELATRSPNALTLVNRARAPTTPAGPSRTLIVAVGAASALAVTILAAYAFSGVRRSWDQLPLPSAG